MSRARSRCSSPGRSGPSPSPPVRSAGNELVHSCYAEARRRRSWTANVRVLPVDGPAGVDDLLSVDDRDRLDRAFRRLSIEQRAVFVLHQHEGRPLVEIAESLGIPAGTARSRLYYATRVLRAAIEIDDRPVATEGRLA